VTAGHTIGTHSQNHPLRLEKMPLIKAEQEIHEGIASMSAALGEPPAPFLRIPGLARANRSVLGIPEADDLERRLPGRRPGQDHSSTGAFRWIIFNFAEIHRTMKSFRFTGQSILGGPIPLAVCAVFQPRRGLKVLAGRDDVRTSSLNACCASADR
jgi:peptidoglycan/xylan/chitin deacetylase (PgdA/CDA1 family)